MKPGELVRVDYPKNDLHNQLGIVVNVDKSMKTWPGDRIYYDVMMGNGEVLNFRYEQLIFSEDLYFSRDDYFSSRCKTP